MNLEAITYNPAYVEGKVYCLPTSYIIHYHHYTYIVNRLVMRSRRMELETNPSYITVQPSYSRTYVLLTMKI